MLYQRQAIIELSPNLTFFISQYRIHRIGAGKTFTMLGTENEPGIMALTLNDLYRQMETSKGDEMYTVKMSYLEVLIFCFLMLI